MFSRKILVRKNQDLDFFDYKDSQGGLNFDIIKYHEMDQDYSVRDIYGTIQDYIKTYAFHPNDIVILSSKVDFFRGINECWIENEKTQVMFETFRELSQVVGISCESIAKANASDLTEIIKVHQEPIKKIRRRKKCHYHQNSGLIKLSTVHSFKGLESKTVFYFIDKDDTPELIFTAITRAVNNLIVFDSSGTKEYKDFFTSQTLVQ